MNPFASLFEHGSIHIGVKLLLVIVVTEVMIMFVYQLLGIDLNGVWAALSDTLILGVISSIVIYFWVFRPLKRSKQQNDLFNTLVNNVDVGVVVTDPSLPDNPVIYTNPAFTRITGYQSHEVLGNNPRLLQGEETDQSALQQTREAIHEGKAVRVLQRNRRKNGGLFWNDLHLSPIISSSEKIQFWVGLLNDVTATKELERENLRWGSALQQSDEAVCVFDEDGVIEFANDAYCANVRLSAESIIGRSTLPFWDQDSQALENLKESLIHNRSWSGRHRRRRADQTTYDALTSITPIHDNHGSVSFVCVHRDVSEMVAMEEQLRQSQKMEAVGMLVGGIAHDFNNVLAGILGNLYLIKRKLKDEPKLYRRIEGVEEQGYAAAGMVRQLLSFSRKGLPDVKDIDLVSFSKDLLKFARVSVPENMKLDGVVEVEGELVVRCDPVQMQQSLLNLIVNATHAIADKEGARGEIILRLSTSSAPAKDLMTNDSWAHHPMPAGWACISLEDNGSGMDQATRSRIFEPFFTTKSSSVGTGLGLAMVQGYVEMLHGAIDVKSELNEGTRFDIFLPLSANEANVSDKERNEVRMGSGEFILVADDDEHVRMALCDILESANYQVIEACNGEEAMALFAEYARKLDMVILDVVMPKATGVEVASYIRGLQQDFPIAFMTGYDKENTLSLDINSAHALIRKPWDVEQLNIALESSLNKTGRKPC